MNTELKPIVVPADHPCFAGHFPGNPLVPGALLTQWLVDALASSGQDVSDIKQLKFLHPVRPGDIIQLTGTPGSDDKTLTIKADVNGQPVFHGKLELRS